MANKNSRAARLRNEYSQLLVPLVALLLIILFNLVFRSGYLRGDYRSYVVQ